MIFNRVDVNKMSKSYKNQGKNKKKRDDKRSSLSASEMNPKESKQMKIDDDLWKFI